MADLFTPKVAKIYIDCGVAKAQGARPHQEDSFSIAEDNIEKCGFAIYSVFDGHGSDQYSGHASKNMKDFITSEPEFKKKDYVEALKKAFHQENESLKSFFKNSQKGGTTATVLLIADGVLYCADVGDSRCVLARKESSGTYSALRCSRDHSFKDKKERQRVIESGGDVEGNRVYTHGHGINMTRALGDFDFKSPYNQADGDWISAIPDIRSITLTPEHEFLILASDGLWTEMDDDDVVDVVAEMRKKGMSAQDIAEALVGKISKKPRSDNITVIIVDFSWDETHADKRRRIIPVEMHTVHKPVQLSG